RERLPREAARGGGARAGRPAARGRRDLHVPPRRPHRDALPRGDPSHDDPRRPDPGAHPALPPRLPRSRAGPPPAPPAAALPAALRPRRVQAHQRRLGPPHRRRRAARAGRAVARARAPRGLLRALGRRGVRHRAVRDRPRGRAPVRRARAQARRGARVQGGRRAPAGHDLDRRRDRLAGAARRPGLRRDRRRPALRGQAAGAQPGGELDLRDSSGRPARGPPPPATLALPWRPGGPAMPLDPQAKFLLDQLAARGGPQLHELEPAQAREAFEALKLPIPGEAVASVQDLRLPGPAGEIPGRLYVPEGAPAPSGALVYFHGGGWVIGSLETRDSLCRALANRSGARVVSVDYRLAPEHRWPAAAEDCYAMACHLA